MELTIQVASQGEAMVLFGLEDRNLKLIREALPVSISARNGLVRLSGERQPVEEAAEILNRVLSLIRSGSDVGPDYVQRHLDALKAEGTLVRRPAASGELPTTGIRV